MALRKDQPVVHFAAGMLILMVLLLGVGLSGLGRANVSVEVVRWTVEGPGYADLKVVNHGRLPIRVMSVRIEDPRIEVTSISNTNLSHAERATVRVHFKEHCDVSVAEPASIAAPALAVRTALRTTPTISIAGLGALGFQRCS